MSRSHNGLAAIALALLVATSGTAWADPRRNDLTATVAACHRDLVMKDISTPAKRQDDPGPAPKPLAEVIDMGRGTCRKIPVGIPTDGWSPVDERPVPVNQRPLLVVSLLANIRF